MSKSTRQAVLLLSMVHGSLKILIQDGFTEVESISGTLLYASEVSEKAIVKYRCTGDERKNLAWMIDHLNKWKLLIDEPTINWPPFVLVTLSQNIIEDLLSLVKEEYNRNLILEVADCIRSLARNIEAKNLEEEYSQLDITTDVLQKMYDLIEFYPRG